MKTTSSAFVAFAFLSYLCLSRTSVVAAGESAQTAAEKINNMHRKYSTPSPADAQDLLPYFKDFDPAVRHSAYMTAMSASVSTAEQIFALMDAAESDSDPNARQQARNAWESLRVRPNTHFPGVDRRALPELEQIASSDDGKTRLKAVVALDAIGAPKPEERLGRLECGEGR